MLEHGDKPGRKILISGGGRFNFTNIHTAPDRFLSANPHFAKSALSRYTPADFVALVESHGIAWHEKTLGQLFCDGSARQIVDMLLTECAQGGVQVTCGETVRQVEHDLARERRELQKRVPSFRPGPRVIGGSSGPHIEHPTGKERL